MTFVSVFKPLTWDRSGDGSLSALLVRIEYSSLKLVI